MMYENIFFDLADRDLLVLLLQEPGGPKDTSKNAAHISSVAANSSTFSFKGKCMMALLWGQVYIKGYSIRASTQSAAAPIRWFELFSPECNSFLSIRNGTAQSRKRKADVDENLDQNRDVRQTLIDQMRVLLNSEIPGEIETKFVEFLTNRHFNPKTSSLVLLAPLKSHLCNYVSYFPNFQAIYNSKQQQQALSSPTSNPKNNETLHMSKFGLYQVASPSLVFNETDEFTNVVDEIVNGGDATNTTTHDETTHQIASSSPPIIMACGGKDVGKSTLLRFLINSLLNKYPKVAYIDCDPGQTEFTLGGCLSLNLISEPLFGPPHTHIGHASSNKTCYFLGHLSPNDVPSYYLDCLRQCAADFDSLTKPNTNNNNSGRAEKLPLVVNTMGWNQGLGLCLLKESMLIFKPTHVIQINHPIEANKNMPVLDASWLNTASGWPPRPPTKQHESANHRQASNVDNESSMSVDDPSASNTAPYKLYTVKSAVPKSQPLATNTDESNRATTNKKRFSPRDHRNLAIVAYFSRLQHTPTFVPIHHLRPYRIGWSKIGLHVSHMRIDLSQLFNVFNASLVGLCRCDPKYIRPWRDNENHLPRLVDFNNNNEASSPNKGASLKCFGFGIVRGINMETREFYVLTPEPLDVLEQVNVMAKGMLPLPLEFFYEQDYQTSCPYMTFTTSSTSPAQPAQRKYLVHQGGGGNNNSRR